MAVQELGGARGASRMAFGRADLAIVGLAFGFIAFLRHIETDWYFYTPAIGAFLALAGLLYAASRRWRFAVLTSLLFFAGVHLVAGRKFDLVAMNLHVYDVYFYAMSSAQLAFFVKTYPKLAGAVALSFSIGLVAILAAFRLERPAPKATSRRGLVAALSLLVGAGALSPLLYYRASFFDEGRNTVTAFLASFGDLPKLFRTPNLLETRAAPSGGDAVAPAIDCRPTGRPPHVILLLSESTLPPGVYPELKFPPETRGFFASLDGEVRRLRVETFGGGTWLSDFSALSGLPTRAFGTMRNFVVQFMTGRLRHALPAYMRACGYDASIVYPSMADFAGSGRFYKAIGFDRVVDAAVHGSKGERERDAFYYGEALKILEAARGGPPQFIALSSMGTHAPWDFRFAPEALKPGEKTDWNGDPVIDEYMWRLVLAARDQRAFRAALRERFPGESFLIVTYGDHQPAFTRGPVPDADAIAGEGRALDMPPTLKLFETYYAIDAVNYRPAMPPKGLPILEIAHLPTIVVEAARLPLDPVFRRRALLLRVCAGLYGTCPDKDAILDFQTWLVAQGWVAPS